MRNRLHGLAGTIAALALWLGGVSPLSTARADGRFSIDSWGTGQWLLPDSEVIAMTRTHDGYLWLGTLNGLVRFDGVRFTVFDESNTPRLESVRIVRLFEDSRSNLWVGTESAGAVLIKDGSAHSLNIGRGRRTGHLASVCEDATGAVWLLTEDGELGRFAHGLVDVWKIGNDSGRSVIAEKSGTVWVATGNQVFGLDPAAARTKAPLPIINRLAARQVDLLLASRAGGYWCLADGVIRKYSGGKVERDFGPYPWMPAPDAVKAACEDRDGNLIVGTGGSSGQGVFWFEEQGKAVQISAKDGLSNDSVLSLDADAEGSLWVGLDGGGLNRVKRRIFRPLEQTAGSVAQSLCPDQHGGLWISAKSRDFTYWKDGVLHTNGSFPPIRLLNPTAVLVDHEQRVWGGTQPARGSGLFRLEGEVFRPDPGVTSETNQISSLYEDHAGVLWVGTLAGLGRRTATEWQLFTTNDGLSANIVHAIAEDHAGNLWIGTEGGGLNCRWPDGHFSALRQSEGFPSDNISALYADGEDVLWIGTFGNGLVRLQQGKWTHYTTQDGLIGNSIDYLIEDGDGFLWIGSNAGLMRARKKDLNDFVTATNFISCRGYDKRDGLPATECTFGVQPAACRTADGNLWFPTIAGVVSVNPAEIHSNTNPPPVVIESVRLEDQVQNTKGPHAAPPQSVSVPAGQEHLEIQFTSLNLDEADRARFRYQLEGHETTWNEAGNRRFARYPTLPPGQYRFHVEACNEDGVWNETGASLAVTVLPLFWQTGWFRAAAVGALLGMVIAAVYYLSTQALQRQVAAFRQQQALEKERARIARDIHDQVGASLTQLALLGEMVEEELSGEAEGHARQISQTARETSRALDEIVWTVNPSNDTLDGLVTYICKHAQDYLAVAGVRYRLDAPAQLPQAPISPEARHNVFLAAKEAVTNIVKHARASEAWLHLRLEPDRFTLEIEDNGRGPAGLKEKAAESRNGLRNMRKRMEDVGGQFFIGPGRLGGTVVRLTVPLARK